MFLLYVVLCIYTVISCTLILVIYKLYKSVDNLYDLIKKRIP